MLSLLAALALSPQHDFDMSSPTHWDGLGMQVFFLDDINGDGIPEFGCGSFCTDLRDNNSGSVYIFDGATQQGIRRHDGYGHQARLGESAISIPDIDGDGFRDYMSGARNETAHGLRRGVVYVWSGLTGDVIHTLAGREKEGDFGRGLAWIHDIDGDGVLDLAIGAPSERSERGTVGLYSGATGENFRTFSGPGAGAQFGYSVASIADMNGDGVRDLAVGAPMWDNDKGGVYFYSGVDGQLLAQRLGQDEGSRFGWKIVDVGDVNQDGRPEIMVGEPCTDRAYLITSTTGNNLRVYQGQVNPTKSGVGHEMASAGDFNGDGYPDYAIGHPGEWDYNTFTLLGAGGGVRIYSGKDGILLQEFAPFEDDDSFGSSVAIYPEATPVGRMVLIGAPAWGDLSGGHAPGMVSGRIVPEL